MLLGLCVSLTGGPGSRAAGEGKKNAERAALFNGKTLNEWIQVLKGNDLSPKLQALFALQTAGPKAKDAAPVLIDLFRDRKSEFLHGFVALTLARIGPAALPDLRKALKHKRAEVRTAVVLTLGIMAQDVKEAIPELITAAEDKDRSVRRFALSTLADSGPRARQAAAAAAKALNDEDVGVRVNAAELLWKATGEHKAAVPVLVAAVPDPAATERAAEILAAIGPPAVAAIPALKKELTTRDPAARLRVAEALWKVGQDVNPVLPVVEKLFRDGDDQTRREAVRVLGHMPGEAKAVTLLQAAVAKDPNPRVRRLAARGLGSRLALARVDANALRAGLRDADEWVRWLSAAALLAGKADLRREEAEVVAALRGAGPGADADSVSHEVWADLAGPRAAAEVVPTLIAAARRRGGWLKVEVIRQLGPFKERATSAVPALLEALQSDDSFVRRAAADSLGQVGGDAIPRLRKLLGNPDSRLREGAARALGRVGLSAKAAVPVLKRLLKDESSAVRTQAALALWSIAKEAVVAAHALNLVRKNVDNKDRWEAVEALAVVAAEARPPVRGLTEVFLNSVKDRDARVRVHAVRALWGRTRQVHVVEPLLRDAVKDRDSFVRRTAMEVLGEVGETGAAVRIAPLLGAGLADKDPSVRLAALEGLVRTEAAGVPQLVLHLKDKNARVRAAVVTALGRIGRRARQAVPELVELRKDPDAVVRRAVEDALERIAPREANRDLYVIIDLLQKLDKTEKDQAAKLQKKLEDSVKPKK
jgi:HEAT repeat protein